MKLIPILAASLLAAVSAESRPHHRPHHHPDVLLFEDTYNRGESLALNIGESIADLDRVPLSYKDWNDELSSVELRRDVAVILYEHSHFRGRSVTLDASSDNLRQTRADDHRLENWNDRVSSIRVVACRAEPPSRGHGQGFHHGSSRHAPVQLFEHERFGGAVLSLEPGDSLPDLGAIGWNDKASSVRITGALSIQLFEHSHFRGRSIIVTTDQSSLFHRNGWNDRASSLKVLARL